MITSESIKNNPIQQQLRRDRTKYIIEKKKTKQYINTMEMLMDVILKYVEIQIAKFMY